MLQLLITFVWFGLNIPEDYIIKFSKIDYPTQILLNPTFNTSLKLDVEKSDRYRLQILRYGGVYCDFDNTITNYTLLMEKLQKFDGEIGIMQINADGNPGNNFIYVPHNRTGLVNRILDQNPIQSQLCQKNILQCGGPALFNKYKQNITVLDIWDCVQHTGDWSWWKEQNIAENTNRNPIKYFVEKLIKKDEFIQQVEQLKKKQVTPQVRYYLLIISIISITFLLWVICLTKFLFRIIKQREKLMQTND